MKSKRTVLLIATLLVIAFMLTACEKSGSKNVSRETIVAANNQILGVFNTGNAANFVARAYTKDAQLLPPNSDFVNGSEALEGFWQALLDMGIRGVKLETIEVEGAGDTAFDVGKYTLLGDAGKVLDKGKYVVIWKQEDGQWKWHRDIFNSSLPAQK